VSNNVAARKRDKIVVAESTPERTARRRRSRGQRTLSQTFPSPTVWQRLYHPLRRSAEVGLCLLLLVVAAPVILLAALVVRLSSRGPAFYTQLRLGQFGRPFTIFKIRTMIHNCESLTGPRWAIPGDPRVTLIGHILRLTHIDELPQLVNVLRGDMSLIGPRPERPEFVQELEKLIPHYAERHAVRPGVTGLAQVQLAPDTDVDTVRRKLAYDLFYVRHLGPLLDLGLLCCTATRLAGIPFTLAGKFFRVPGKWVVEGPDVDEREKFGPLHPAQHAA
jgi:lipopolysaccharide/colanic/teichoic acid biosynthesis glycosyltransferase